MGRFADGDSGKNVALGGPDGRKVEQLLSTSIEQGTRKLSDLARQAVKRLIEARGDVTQLFTDEERQELADQLAATNATAELLGRVRIAERAQEAERRAKKLEDFSDFCGGKGGKPGPCPTGKAATKVAGKPPGATLQAAKATAAKPTVDGMANKIQGLVGKKLKASDAAGLVGEMATMKKAELKQLGAKLAAAPGGTAKVATAKKAAAAAVAKAKASPKPVPPEVTKPTEDLSDRAATDPSLGYDDIKQHVAGLGKKSKAELTAIAKSVDVTPGSKASKASLLKSIENSIMNRKGMRERTII